MRPLPPQYLLFFYLLFEIYVSLSRGSRQPERTTADEGSLRLIWNVVAVCSLITVLAVRWLPQLQWRMPDWLHHSSVGIFVLGMSWRWHAILYLGRYFTVDLSVQPRQPVIDTGPYRLIRHPSYLGSLLMFIGTGLTFGHPVAMLFMIVPTTLVLLHRIRIEERMLLERLGPPYQAYLTRTKRLVPFVY
jgi:protein-S-isoprenylcysteine O-methyltransferase